VGVGVVQSVEMGKEMVTSLVCRFDANTNTTTGGGGSSGDSALVVATHHQGMVSVHHGSRRLHCSFPAHEFDAWCVAQALEPLPQPASDDDFGLSVPPSAYRRSRNIIFTGGDDAKLKVWDLDPPLLQTASQQQQQHGEDANSASDDDSSSAAAAVPQMKPLGSASFGAGVVTIVPLSPLVCLVGTYDEKVHLVDLRTLQTPAARRKSVDAEDAAISTVAVDGGAWRIRELSSAAAAVWTAEASSCDRFFVVAAMQAGAKLVGLESKTGRLHNLGWAHRATPLHNFSTIITKQPQQQPEASGSAAAAAAETQPAEVVVPQEPLIYDVAELCIGGKPAIATVSFYANELRMWA
jgi:hypothetical protein